MKYAVIQRGNKQYLVEEGSSVVVDRMDKQVGDKVKFGDVLLFVDGENVEIGTPTLNYEVTGVIADQVRDKKKMAIKYQPGGYRRKFGSKQKQTVIEIKEIKKARTKKEDT